MALRDPLTGIANRRALEERLAIEWERSRRNRQPLAILLADVDMLKQVNDERGHEAGDQLLKIVSQRLSDSVRAVDLVGRYGGDEFVIICPDTPAEAAERVAGKLISAVRGQYLPPPLQGVPVSISIGWAARNGETGPADLLREADAALYRAKALGQGRSARESSPPRGDVDPVGRREH
jgi:diguanylate cyclase (GGDEF)-like protein